MNYFWGPEDTSVHFCEDKYDKVFWIAEFYNTISCIFYILSGYILLKLKGNKNIGMTMILLGIGSATLHMTMRYYGQWIDELSMLTLCFYGIKKVKKNLSEYILFPIYLVYYYLNEYFIYFFVFFASSQLYLGYESIKMLRNKKYNLKKKILIVLYVQLFIMGSICWFFDQYYCNDLKQYNLHAWWHFFTSTSALCGFAAFS